LTYEYVDPETQTHDGDLYQGDLPKGPFNEPKPEAGYEFIPPMGTVPQPMIVQAMTRAILKMLNENGCTFEGQTNSEGLKHGKGVCKYIDGSVYDGTWVEGRREGEGEFRLKDGTTYKGEWANDMKHGNGKIIMPNGETITA
jgi:hypothetical protein